MLSTDTDRLTVPIEKLTEARLHLAFGGGELFLSRAEGGVLVAGTFEGGVIERSDGHGGIDLEPSRGRPWHPVRWDVAVSGEIPIDLLLETGANRSTIDLGALRIRRLEIRTGASETRIRLPSTGRTAVRLSCGFASVEMEVPQGVAARVRGKVWLGSTMVDQARFPRTADAWISPDFDTAKYAVDIEVDGGFGSARIS